jgi:hypothetical protein
MATNNPSRRLGLCLLAVSALAGCGDQAGTQANWFAPPAQTRPATATQPAGAHPFARRPDPTATQPAPVVFQIRFDIVRASVPIGEVSGSGKIWNYVNEEIISADWSAHLRRNGIRIGLGNVSAWTPIRANLEAIRGTRSSTQPPFLVGGGSPLTIELSPTPRDQVLFMYRPTDAKPVGADFRSSVNAFRIEYVIPPTELDSVALRIVPEVRQRFTDVEHRLTLEGTKSGPTGAARTIPELAFEIVVPPDHFVMIGPSAAIKTELLIGRAILGETMDGQPYESIFFITPQVTQKTTAAPP